MTFYLFDFSISCLKRFEKVIRLPDVLTLAAMKAFAFGYRAKWKDHIDMYFIMRDHYSLDKISAKAKKLFGGEFNAKLFREKLSYFGDIDYREEVEFIPDLRWARRKLKKPYRNLALVEVGL